MKKVNCDIDSAIKERMIKWINSRKYFTYNEFAKEFKLNQKYIKKIFIANFEKYHYKIRRNSLVYNRVIKVEDILIEVGDFALTKKIITKDDTYYITEKMSKKYGVPCEGSYFSPMSMKEVLDYKVCYIYVVSFYFDEHFYPILRLITELNIRYKYVPNNKYKNIPNNKYKYKVDTRTPSQKLAAKYQFENISMKDIIQSINSIVK